MNIAFYVGFINDIGGVESWLYYISRMYGANYNLTLYYDRGSEEQLQRYKDNNIIVKKYYGQQIKCDKAIFCYDLSPINNFIAKEKIQFIHSIINKDFVVNPKITRFIAVSKAAQSVFEEITGKKCEVLYNPIVIDKPKKVLRLISPTRLSSDKGEIWKRMNILADKLDEANIPYLWLVFTNNKVKNTNKHIIFVEPELNIENHIKDADYLVQLSTKESASYTVKQALMLGTPVLVTNFNTVKELNIEEGKNGYVFDMNMRNVDVDKIYNNIPTNFKYKPNESLEGWSDLLGKAHKDKKIKYVKVKCIYKEGFTDLDEGKFRNYKEEWITTLERANELTTNFTNPKIIDIIN